MTAQATKPIKIDKRKHPLKPKPGTRTAAIIGAKVANPKLSTRQIAAITGSDSSNVSRVLRHYEITTETKEFKEHRADMLAELQQKIVSSITAGDIKEAKLRDRVISAGVLYDKERLERGLSTENIAYDGRNITASISEIRAELDKLKVGDEGEDEAETA